MVTKKKHKGVIYISVWEDFLKVGITNTTAHYRKSIQEDRSGLKGEILFESPRICGTKIFDLELSLPKHFDKKIVDRGVFPDGFSECYNKEDYECILNYIQTEITNFTEEFPIGNRNYQE